MADETTRVDAWLQTVLEADTALVAAAPGGVHGTTAPAGVTFPYVLHNFQAAVDVAGVGPDRIMLSGLWLVKGVTQSESYLGALKTIADRIDAVLHAAASATNGAGGDGTVFSCTREQPFRLPELVDGVHYRHLGGLYRIYVQVPGT